MITISDHEVIVITSIHPGRNTMLALSGESHYMLRDRFFVDAMEILQSEVTSGPASAVVEIWGNLALHLNAQEKAAVARANSIHFHLCSSSCIDMVLPHAQLVKRLAFHLSDLLTVEPPSQVHLDLVQIDNIIYSGQKEGLSMLSPNTVQVDYPIIGDCLSNIVSTSETLYLNNASDRDVSDLLQVLRSSESISVIYVQESKIRRDTVVALISLPIRRLTINGDMEEPGSDDTTEVHLVASNATIRNLELELNDIDESLCVYVLDACSALVTLVLPRIVLSSKVVTPMSKLESLIEVDISKTTLINEEYEHACHGVKSVSVSTVQMAKPELISKIFPHAEMWEV